MTWLQSAIRAPGNRPRASTVRPLIEKTRYIVEHEGFEWEVDVFEGDNAGLVVAEVELPSIDVRPPLPDWTGREVSDDLRYYNVSLQKNPYCTW